MSTRTSIIHAGAPPGSLDQRANEVSKLCAVLSILMLTVNSGKTGIAKFINHNLKETASTVQQ